MNKCIVCECAAVLYYEPPKERPPIKCPNCGRDTRHYTSMKEDDPRVGILVDKYKSRLGGTEESNANATESKTEEAVKKNTSANTKIDKLLAQEISPHIYSLVSKAGTIRIQLPADGGVIGRTAIGGEELAHNGRISREHIRLTPAKRAQGVIAEDLSANGTYIDGRRLVKGKEEFVVIGSVIKMGGEEFILERSAEA